MRSSTCTRRSRARATSSRTRSSAAWFPRNTSRPSTRVSRKPSNTGVLAGYPVEDVARRAHRRFLPRRRLFRGCLQGCRLHGHQGRALRKSDPVILEPVMAVEVETPEEYTGFVMGDIPVPPRHDPGPGAARRRRRHLRRRCRWARCSATLPTCVPARRVAQPTPCSSTLTSRFPRTWLKRLSARPAATRRASNVRQA